MSLHALCVSARLVSLRGEEEDGGGGGGGGGEGWGGSCDGFEFYVLSFELLVLRF